VTRVDDVALALGEPRAEGLERVGAWVSAVHRRAAAIDTRGVAFLVLSPFALRERAALEAGLSALGVTVRARTVLRGWSRVTTAFRVSEPAPDLRRLRAAELYERAWEALFPGASGEAWALDAGRDHGRVAAAKRALRAGLPHLRVHFGAAGISSRLLTPFHLADREEAEEEARRLVAAVLLDPTDAPAPTGRAPT
jgi:hypothetical protein